MPWAENIPRPHNGAVQTASAEGFLALCAHLRVRAHDRGWMRNTHVDEVLNVRFVCYSNRLEPGFKIDLDERPRFGRTRMGNPDQVDKRVCTGYSLPIRITV